MQATKKSRSEKPSSAAQLLGAAIQLGNKNADVAARAYVKLEDMRDAISKAIWLLERGRASKALEILKKAEVKPP
jgi:hypothetical protein